MTPIKRAVLKYPDRDQAFLLFRINPKSYRWNTGEQSVWLDSNDNPNEPAAILWLRDYCNKNFPGADLTIYPMADAPDMRAAKKICELSRSGYAPNASEPWGDYSDIIRRETRCDELLAALNELAAYIATRLADRDPALNPIMLKAIKAVESASDTDLGKLKKLYETAVENASRRIII